MHRGDTVILTRAAEDNSLLAAALRARGVEVIELPCVRTVHLADPTPIAIAIRALGPDDRLVFTSRAGVDAARRAVTALEVRAPVAAVGPATAARCAEWGIAAWTPSMSTGGCLGRELVLGDGVVLLVRAEHADGAIVRKLRQREAEVREVVAYRLLTGASGDVPGARRAALAGAAVVLASPSAVGAFAAAIGPDALASARLLAIGPTTARAVTSAVGRAARVLRSLSVDEITRELEVFDVAHR